MPKEELFNPTENPFYVGLFVVTGFVVTSIMLTLIYVTCSKKYKLNWYEKNLLERRKEMKSATSIDSLNEEGTHCDSISQRSGSIIIRSTTNLTVSEEVLPNAKVMNLRRTSRPSLSESITSIPSDLEGRSPTKTKPQTMQTKLDPSKIDASLYQNDENDVENKDEINGINSAGKINLKLSYDINAGILTVHIIDVLNLLGGGEINGSANPYVKIKLLPYHTNIWQTRIHKKTLNPVFDEDFVFEVTPQEIRKYTLEITLCDFVAYSRHRNIGILRLPLSQVDLSQGTIQLEQELMQCNERETKAELGDLLVSLAYLPSAERLTITIVKARNLKIVDDQKASSDPFVKVSLLVDGKRIKKQKTGIHRNTISPIFNEALTFKLNKDLFRRCSIEFRVFHDNLLLGSSSELLGTFILGNETNLRIRDRQIHAQLVHDFLVPVQWISLTDTY